MASIASEKELMSELSSEPVRWMRAKQVFVVFGIGKTTLYRLVKEGRIESRSIVKLGASKGVRVFSVESIKALLTASNL
jgi:predicted DNA-binding transcriptional regulator AlpA